MSRISAVVPVWNGRELLASLLESLARQTHPVTEVLVVDNGSADGAPDLARADGARVLSMGRNAGFAAAVNRGIGASSGEWIAVLNSDVELAPDYLERLLAAAAGQGAWFATGRILSAANPSVVDGTFDAVCRGATAWRIGSGRADGLAFAAARAIHSAPWTAALFRRDLFGRAGLLAERFESYLEDVDFGLRCAALGFEGVYVPGALAWHRGSAALGRWHPETVRRMARNQVYLVARHYPPALVARWLWPILVAQVAWGCVAARHGAATAWLRGKWEGLRDFSVARRETTPIGTAILQNIMRANERAIRQTQAATGFDLYWRLYFVLTRGGAE